MHMLESHNGPEHLVVFITSDQDFGEKIQELQRRNFKVAVIYHEPHASKRPASIIHAADESYIWLEFLAKELKTSKLALSPYDSSVTQPGSSVPLTPPTTSAKAEVKKTNHDVKVKHRLYPGISAPTMLPRLAQVCKLHVRAHLSASLTVHDLPYIVWHLFYPSYDLTECGYLQASRKAAAAKQASKKQSVSDKVCKNTNASMQSGPSASSSLQQSNLNEAEQACNNKNSGPLQVRHHTVAFCFLLCCSTLLFLCQLAPWLAQNLPFSVIHALTLLVSLWLVGGTPCSCML